VSSRPASGRPLDGRAASEAGLHARASEIFVAVRDLAPDARRPAIEAAAAEDPRLRAEIESLLEHDVQDVEGPSEPGHALEPPARIGPYRLVRPIGQGSSGRVFLAEQEVPIRRRVAIKIVPQAALGSELAARFEVERRALERTEHPNIARILDAGRTPADIPYLVMEYVEGPPITEYCEERRLPLLERVRLMLDVAGAVQHAHQCGVIHRDLKPANILVARVQGRPIPCVLDFGIAKPVAGIFPEDTPPTSGLLPIGTPAYMAPEQTGLSTVDTRADVYALAAVLYELVAGRPPIDGLGDPYEVLRRIREERPLPASRVRAQTAPARRLAAAVLGDLDVILAKALEKSRERRYSTVAALAEDLTRLLRREPIEARAPTLRYRAARFVQRNRVLVAAGIGVALALFLGVAGLAAGIVQARRERGQAVLQSESQQEINRFLTEDLLAQASPDRAGPDVTVLELLRRASRNLEHRFWARPLIAASVHQALGGAYAELGSLDDAADHLGRALELRRNFAGRDAPDTVRSEIASAGLLARRGDFEAAEGALRAAVARARTFLGKDDRDLYTALNDLGVTLETKGDLAGALPVLEEALEGRRRILGPVDREVLTTLSNLALAWDARGETQRSLAMLLEAQEVADALPDAPRFTQLGLANNVAATYQDLGRDLEAAPHLLKAAAMAAEVLGPDHPGTLTIQANLAALEAKLGDPLRALELYREIVARRTATLGGGALDTLVARHGASEALRLACRLDQAVASLEALQGDVDASLGAEHVLSAQTSASLARALLDAGRAAEALAWAERAETRLRELFGADHFRTRTARELIDRVRSEVGLAASGAGEEAAPVGIR